MKRTPSVVAVLLALLMAGCGGGADTAPAGASPIAPIDLPTSPAAAPARQARR